MLATLEIAGLPFVITRLVMAGGLVAALSTADGLLLTISNTLSHGLYYKIINPNASIVKRLTTTRVLLVAAVIGVYVATFRINIIVAGGSVRLCIGGFGVLPGAGAGIFWKWANKQGTIASMIVGFLTALGLIVLGRNWGIYPFGIRGIGAGVIGVPVGFLVIWLVSLRYPQQTVKPKSWWRVSAIPRVRPAQRHNTTGCYVVTPLGESLPPNGMASDASAAG